MQETHKVTIYLNPNGKYSLEIKSDFHDKHFDQFKDKSLQTYGIEEDNIENALNKAHAIIKLHEKEK